MKAVANTAEFMANLLIERNGAGEFVSLLKTEQEALRDGAAERLETLARDKLKMAQHLSALAQQRARHLAAAGFSPDAQGMESWIAAHPRNAGAAAAWRDLRRFAEEARALNQANGALINLQLRHHQQMLTALGIACGTPALYGPHGQALPVSHARQLGAA